MGSAATRERPRPSEFAVDLVKQLLCSAGVMCLALLHACLVSYVCVCVCCIFGVWDLDWMFRFD